MIGGWLAVEGPGVLESRGAAFDKHTVYGDASALDTPLFRVLIFRTLGIRRFPSGG